MRARRYLFAGRLAWRGARQARRHRWLGFLAWRGVRWYVFRRPRISLRLALGAAVAAGGALRAVRGRRRPPP